MESGSDFGRRLRQAREQKGVSLRDISVKTKISLAALEALERDDISRLPGGIFSRAFVRSYASEVGLDPEQMVEDFMTRFPQDSVTAGTPLSSQADDNEAIESERRVAETVLKLLLVSVPIAGALIYFSFTGRPAGDAPAETAVSVAGDAPAVPAASSEGSAPSSGSGGAPEVARGPSAALVVAIKPTAPCWMSITVDGERRAGRTLLPGDDMQLSATSEIVLTAGDAAAVQLTINGAQARPLGRSGAVVTKRINLYNYRSLLQ
jgi:cytoskeleton protein RodZ